MTVFALSGCQHGEVRSSATQANLKPLAALLGALLTKLGYYHNCRGTVGVFFYRLSLQNYGYSCWGGSRFQQRVQEDNKMLLPPQEGSVAATVCTFVSVSEGDVVPTGVPCTASPTAMPLSDC